MKPNLVIGAVRDYNFEQLRPFVVSLKHTSFNGDLVLLWNNLRRETLDALNQHGVKLVHFSYRGSGSLNSWSRFWPWLRPFLRCPVGDGVRKAVYKKILNLAFVRYIHALEFIEARADKYGNALLTDVRDVIFQDDPFRDPLSGDIVAFLESPNMVYGREAMNDGWVLENLGPVRAAKFPGNRISCCGTVAGSTPGMIRYLKSFFEEISGLQSVAHGADTSIHNVLVRDVLAGQIAVAENFQAMVGTVNSPTEFVIGSDGRVLAPSGTLVPVLHQYDRQPALATRLIQRLCATSLSSSVFSVE